jgi:organic radical activating enzyme
MNIIAEIDLDLINDNIYSQLHKFFKQNYQEVFQPDDRIVVRYTKDRYNNQSVAGEKISVLQNVVNQIDISNCFIQIYTTNINIKAEIEYLAANTVDPTPMNATLVDGSFNLLESAVKKKAYDYNSKIPNQINVEDLTERERELLLESDTFCIYPWIHLHAYPTGEVQPCCHAEHNHPSGVKFDGGNSHEIELREAWNSEGMKQLRRNMLNEEKSIVCTRCYEQEESGFFTGRLSANKHHGHHIKRVADTKEDGTYENFSMTYWDIRFSNLCNLKCRSCGHIFSSQWYKDQIALAGPEWGKQNKQLNYAGRYETDMLEQVLEHIDSVEQVYFAGGEPLVMDEHYAILEALIDAGKTDVRLIYNTNFTQVKLKGKRAFDLWKHFPNVSIGASLDAMEDHAEYIRTLTKWTDVETNRRQLMEECPHVDFYISCTLSIMNALHVTDFHRSWVEKGLIKPQDFNINILQDPAHYRIDIATPEYKDSIREKFLRHLEWLEPLDHLNRASTGYKSALNYMQNDNSALLDKFWAKTDQLDQIRGENILDSIPELKALR